MSFPRYPAYKDSGVEWIGEIPVGWEILTLKRAAKTPLSYGANASAENDNSDWPRFIRITDIDDAGLLREDTFRSLEPEEASEYLLDDGDILFARSGATVGKSFIYKDQYGPACYAGYLIRLKVNNKFLPKYIYYFSLSSVCKEQILSGQIQSTIQNFSAEKYANLIAPLPPFSEQQAIVSFLDRECGKIDTLIAEQERLIALLAEKRQAVISHAVTKGLNPNAPMKDSGIPWIGMVPEGWEVVRLGTIFEEVNESGNENLPILSVSIHTGVSDEELSDEKLDRKVTRSDDRSKYIAVRPGDLTYNMMRAWQGGFGAVQVRGMVSPAYVVARPKNISRQKTDFIELLLRTPNAISEMKRYSRGVTDFRLRLYWEEFKTICISLPTLKEQNEILNFLKEETGHFDALATTARDAITLLKERRAALISAAVTGKIDVRAQSKALAA
ncbi:restriction endonuclease subunit S [Acetobacter pasteurianus]